MIPNWRILSFPLSSRMTPILRVGGAVNSFLTPPPERWALVREGTFGPPLPWLATTEVVSRIVCQLLVQEGKEARRACLAKFAANYFWQLGRARIGRWRLVAWIEACLRSRPLARGGGGGGDSAAKMGGRCCKDDWKKKVSSSIQKRTV